MNWGRSMGSSHRRIRRVGAVFGVATLLLLTVAFMALRPSQTEDATVTRVYDGDTIEALVSGRSEKIRYNGIDTPEMDDPRPAVLEMAQEAAQANRELVGGQGGVCRCAQLSPQPPPPGPAGRSPARGDTGRSTPVGRTAGRGPVAHAGPRERAGQAGRGERAAG